MRRAASPARAIPGSRAGTRASRGHAPGSQKLEKLTPLWKPLICRAVGAADWRAGGPVITLTRFNREAVTVNADLVMCLDTAPETTLTFVNGERLKVLESIDEVKELVLGYKRQVFKGLLQTRNVEPEA